MSSHSQVPSRELWMLIETRPSSTTGCRKTSVRGSWAPSIDRSRVSALYCKPVGLQLKLALRIKLDCLWEDQLHIRRSIRSRARRLLDMDYSIELVRLHRVLVC